MPQENLGIDNITILLYLKTFLTTLELEPKIPIHHITSDAGNSISRYFPNETLFLYDPKKEFSDNDLESVIEAFSKNPSEILVVSDVTHFMGASGLMKFINHVAHNYNLVIFLDTITENTPDLELRVHELKTIHGIEGRKILTDMRNTHYSKKFLPDEWFFSGLEEDERIPHLLSCYARRSIIEDLKTCSK